MTLADAIAEAKANNDFAPVCAVLPYARFLGITAEEQDGALVSILAFGAHNIGNPALPALHGGVIGAFLETAAIFALLWAQETVSVPKIINITVDYLRPAGPRDCFARGVITKQGRRIASVAVAAWQSDPARPVATADCHFLLRSER